MRETAMRNFAIIAAMTMFTVCGFSQASRSVPNAGTTGTTLNSLATVGSGTSGAYTAVIATTSNTSVQTYIVVAGAGTSGITALAFGGQALCTMDSNIGSAAAGDFVIASTTTGGDCHAQSAAPSNGVWVVGYLDSASTTSGSTASVNVNSGFYNAATGTVTSIAVTTANGVSGTSSGGSTPSLTISLGAITPSSVASTGGVSGTTLNLCADTSGSSTAQSCTTTPATFTVTTGSCFTYTTTTTNSGTGLTVNPNSLGAKSIAIPGSSGWTTTLTASIIPANKPLLACYDGTNIDVQQTGTSASGGGLPTGTTGQTVYYASGGTTGTATSGILVGATSGALSGAGVGIGGLEFGAAPVFFDTYGPAGGVTFNGSCSSATTTSCAINNSSSLLDPNGGVLFAGYGDGGNDGELIHYSAATTTTLTFASGGRGYWGSTAQTHGNSVPLYLVTYALIDSATTLPYKITLQTGAEINGFGGSNTIWTNSLPSGPGYYSDNTPFFVGGQISLNNISNNKDYIEIGNGGLGAGSFGSTNASGNFTLATCGNALCYSIATQTIATTATLTALTNVTTPTQPANTTTAAAGTGGVYSSRCHVIWSQATGGTISFAVNLSAAVTRLDVTEVDYDGAAGIVASSFVKQNVTASGTSTAIGTVTPSAFGTVYFSDFTLTMNSGTNAAAVQLYAESSSNLDTLSVYPGSGCSAWN